MPIKKRTQQNYFFAMSGINRAQHFVAMPVIRAQDLCPVPSKAYSEGAMPIRMAHSRNAMPGSKAHSDSAMPGCKAHSDSAMPKSRAQSKSAMPIKINYVRKENSNLNYRKVQLEDKRKKERGKRDWICSCMEE